MTLLSLLIMALLSSLGCWQLQRAEEKTRLLTQATTAARREPTPWSATGGLPQPWQALSVSGRYLPELFLLDNQYNEHRIGYNVLSPLLLQDDTVVLVDRGWIPAGEDRRQLPELNNPEQPLQLSGQAYYPSAKTWVLGETIDQHSGNTTLIEKIDAQIISQLLHKSVYPFIIRLNKNEAYGFVRERALVSMPPERHKAYALQWFAMALVVLILFITLNLKKKTDENTTNS